MKTLALLLITALISTGCAANVNTTPLPAPTLPAVSATAPVAQIDAFTSGSALGTSGGLPVVPLFAAPAVQTNLGTSSVFFWGTKDPASGIVRNVTQAAVYGMQTPPGSAHAFFNSVNLPVLIRDDASGYSIAIVYTSATSLTVTLCDPALLPVGQASATVVAGVAQGADATDGGSCTVALAAPSSSARTAADPAALRTTLAATNLSDLSPFAKLIAGGAYVAGLGFALAAILKFKQHKDNPTVIAPLSTPIALLVIAAVLLFLPTIYQVAGQTLFDPTNVGGVIDGPVVFQTPPKTQ